jgi:hypothetical protein
MKTVHVHNGTSIYADAGTHVSRLFHALRIICAHHFWGAFAQGVMAALSHEKQSTNPHHAPHINASDWNRGYDHGRAALERMSSRAYRIRCKRDPGQFCEAGSTQPS